MLDRSLNSGAAPPPTEKAREQDVAQPDPDPTAATAEGDDRTEGGTAESTGEEAEENDRQGNQALQKGQPDGCTSLHHRGSEPSKWNQQ